MSHKSRANVPHLNVHVPGAGVNLVGVNGGVLNAENLIVVAFVLVLSQFHERLVCLYLVEFNLSLETSHDEATTIERKVDRVVRIFFVEHKLFASI